jgi:hypothetical protein
LRTSVQVIFKRLIKREVSKQTQFTQRAEQLWGNEHNIEEAQVKAVPRGWLNALRAPGVPRQLRGPGHRLPRRVPEPDDAVDRTGETVETLRNLVPPSRPPRTAASAHLYPELPESPGQQKVGQSALYQRVRQIRQNGTWQEMLKEWKALDLNPLHGTSSTRASSAAVSEDGDSCAAGVAENWRIQYSRRLEKKSQASVRFHEYMLNAAAGDEAGAAGGEAGGGGRGGGDDDDAGGPGGGEEIDDRELAFESLTIFKSFWDRTVDRAVRDVKLILP